jgi:rSAM/selenodomain-associated transferase 1
MSVHLLVMAKTPVAGRVKTRLCPPCTPELAARIAAAALADTLDAAGSMSTARRTLVVDGDYAPPDGWAMLRQRGSGLAERLAHAFADAALPGVPALLIGMDTPQVTAGHLAAAATLLATGARAAAARPQPAVDAVLGPATDGGWWALGLRDPARAAVLREVPMSTSDTGARTLAALRGRGLRVGFLPELRDVDTIEDALAVAPLCPAGSRFAAAVPRMALA